MSEETERNKEVVRRFYEEFWCRGNASAADELVAEDIDHGQLPDGWPRGRAGFKRLVETWRTAFPDMHEDILLLIAEGEWVAGAFRLRGTQLGPFYGLEPNGRQVDIRGVDLLRLREGQVVEWIYSEDALGLFEQLGGLPPDLAEVAGPTVGG